MAHLSARHRLFAVGLSVVAVVAQMIGPLAQTVGPIARAASPTSSPSPSSLVSAAQPVVAGTQIAPSGPSSATSSGDGLLGVYYPNTSWSGSPSLVRVDPTIDFDWSASHPIAASDFSVAWSGSIQISTAGTYTFGLDSDDGSTLSIAGNMVVNNGGAHGEQLITNTVSLSVGRYAIAVDYFECCGGPSVVHLYWTPPGGTGLVVVPQVVLYSNAGPPSAQTFGNCGTGWTRCPYRETPEPVNTATGDYVSQVTDLSMPGHGIPFAFTRTYNSLDATVGPLGMSWTHSYAAHLVLNSDGSATFVSDDGAQLLFAPNGSGGFVTPAGGLGTLRTISGGYEAMRHDQIRYDFDTTGRLTAEIDRNGNTLSFGYSSANLTTITDTVGRTITLTYDAAGQLTSLSDPIGRTVTYGYNAAAELASVTDARGGATTYGYDGAGRLTTITDQNGHTLVSNTYDPTSGRVIQQIDALGDVTTFAFDPASGTSTMTDARGGVWRDVYLANKLTSTSDPLGETTRYTYDANFNPISITDPNGHTTSLTYDGAGNLLSRTAPAPLSYLESFTYDAANDLLSHTDGRGNTTSYAYDAAGDLTRTAYPDGTSSSATYDPHGSRLTATDQRGQITTYGYDALGDPTSISSPLGELTTMTYDAVGRMLTRVDPRGNVAGANPALYTTSFGYDAANELLSTTDPLGHVTRTTFDPAGNRTSLTDPDGHSTTYAYDAANHLVSVTDPLGNITAYTYDPTNDLATRTDANHHLTQYAYDLADRLVKTTDPDGHGWTVTYDAAGNQTVLTDANGNPTTDTYDALNRLTGVSYANGTTAPVAYAYDAAGNSTSMTDGAGTESFSYDGLNRLTADTRGSATFRYAYDPAGNLLTRTYPDGTLTSYAYDADGRMASAASGGSTSSYAYDPAGNLVSVGTPDGFTTAYTYDPAGRLTAVATTSTAGTLSSFAYTLDPAGNRTSVTTTRGTMVYAYDAASRLTGVCYSGCPLPAAAAPVPAVTIQRPPVVGGPPPNDTFTNWTYDGVGNRLTQTNYLGTAGYTYDPADRLTAVTPPGSATMAYTYDGNGNELAAGGSSYAYDLANELVAATVGSTTQTYAYSGDGIRLSAATGSQPSNMTQFVVDRLFSLPTVVIERDGNGKLVRRYGYGLDLLSQTTSNKGPYWYHHDGLGSVSDITSSSGSPLWWAEYQPFGLVRSSGSTAQAPLNPFMFSGQYQDSPTGLYYLRARQYDPTIGRFLATDPMSASLGDPSISAYSYAALNPMRHSDPSGRCFVVLCVAAVAGAAIGGVAGAVGYTAAVATENLAAGNGLSLKGWDPFQFAVATATSAGAGAVCAVTLGLGCAAASVAASEVQYQLAPGSKSPLGYLGAGVIGGITATTGGGSLVDEGPLHWDENLVGRMAATFGLDWERKFASQTTRSAVTNWLGGVADYTWNSIIGVDAKSR